MVHKEEKYRKKEIDKKVHDASMHPSGQARSNHMPHSEVVPLRDGNSVNTTRASLFYFRGYLDEGTYNADSFTTSTFTNFSNFVDFVIKGAAVDTLTDCFIKIILTNKNATETSILVKAKYFFERYEVQCNGSATDDTIYADHWDEEDCVALETSEVRMLTGKYTGTSTASYQNYDPTDYTTMNAFDEDGISLAPGDQREFQLPIRNAVTMGLPFLPALSKCEPRFRFYPQKNILLDPNANTNNDIELTSAILICHGITYEECYSKEMLRKYRSRDTHTRVIIHERESSDLQSIVPGQAVGDIQLKTFNCDLAMFTIKVVRSSGIGYGTQYDSANLITATTADYPGMFIPISNITLYDSKTNPDKYSLIEGSYLKSHQAVTANAPTGYFGQKNVYPWIWCRNVRETLLCGADTGGRKLDGNWICKSKVGNFTSGYNNSATPTSAFRFIALGYRYANLIQTKQGQLKLEKL